MQQRFFVAVAFVALLAGCNSGTTSTPAPAATPTPTATPTPAGGQLSASPSSATVHVSSAPTTQLITVTTNVAGTVGETDTCGGSTPILTLVNNGTTGMTTTFTATARSPGTCSITFSSTAGGSATATFTVTP